MTPAGVFESMAHRDHEQVVHCFDRSAGLRAIIAVHSTVLGPALGGCRMWAYASEAEALEDVLRLSRGMTYKAAVAGLNLGGGKAVIIGDPKTDKNEALFRAFGRFVHSLGGRYLTAEDVGTSVRDLEWVRMETPYATGISPVLGGSGDPSVMTAWGVYTGIKASTQERFGTTQLSKFRVAIQGLGNTGQWLAKYLSEEGVELVVTDIDEDKVRRVAGQYGATAVAPDAIYDAEAEIYAPCALGATVNDRTLSRMKFQIIAGAANNVLEVEEKHGPMLREKGILYAPDFVINCGGLINVANELDVYNADRVKRQVENVFETLLEIFSMSKKDGIPTSEAANRVAERRIERIARLGRTWVGPQASQRPRRERR